MADIIPFGFPSSVPVEPLASADVVPLVHAVPDALVIEVFQSQRLSWVPDNGGEYRLETLTDNGWSVVGRHARLPDLLGLPCEAGFRALVGEVFPACASALEIRAADYARGWRSVGGRPPF